MLVRLYMAILRPKDFEILQGSDFQSGDVLGHRRSFLTSLANFTKCDFEVVLHAPATSAIGSFAAQPQQRIWGGKGIYGTPHRLREVSPPCEIP